MLIPEFEHHNLSQAEDRRWCPSSRKSSIFFEFGND